MLLSCTMHVEIHRTKGKAQPNAAFTLAEVVIAIGITAMLFSGIVLAYIQATRTAQWSGYSLAAESLALEQIEQARSAMWDLRNGTDEIENLALLSKTPVTGGFTGYMTNYLDLPTTGTNCVLATNYITVTSHLIGGVAPYRTIRVDTVWPLTRGSKTAYYTNTICTILAPDA